MWFKSDKKRETKSGKHTTEGSHRNKALRQACHKGIKEKAHTSDRR